MSINNRCYWEGFYFLDIFIILGLEVKYVFDFKENMFGGKDKLYGFFLIDMGGCDVCLLK